MRDLLFRLLQAVLRLLRPATSHASPRCVLVLQYTMPLGCCVHGTPVYSALKQALPGVTLVVATRFLGKATLAHDPHIDVLLETADPMSSMPALWRVAQDLRRQLRAAGLRPQWVLQDASSRRGTFALLAVALRLAPTASFANAPALCDVHLDYDPRLSLIDNNLRLVSVVSAPAGHREPAVYFNAVELARAKDLLSGGDAAAQGIIAFGLQGSGGQPTTWHSDRAAIVIQHFEAQGFRTVYLGTAPDGTRIDTIRALACSSGLNLAGSTSIAELAAVLCLCDLLITIDTGILHVGRAAGVPLVVLGPSWQKPLEWLPLDLDRARILRGQDIPAAPPGYKLDEIQTPEVIAAAEELLALYPPYQSAREDRAVRLLSAARS